MLNFLSRLNTKVSKMTPLEVVFWGFVGALVLLIIDAAIIPGRGFF
jgi:hypothetical protein